MFAKLYYTYRNKSKTTKWNAMTKHEREVYLATTTDKGNKRLDFMFACKLMEGEYVCLLQFRICFAALRSRHVRGDFDMRRSVLPT